MAGNEANVDDAGAGGAPAGGSGVVDQGRSQSDGGQAQVEHDDGFTAEERAQFDAMRTGEGVAAGAADGAAAADPGAAGAQNGAERPAAGTAAARTAAEGEGADDDDDDAADAAVPGQQADPNAKPPRRVSYKKFKATEERLRAAQGDLAAKNEMQARLDERLRIINETLTAKPAGKDGAEADDDPEPDADEDFIAHSKWQGRQLAKLRGELGEVKQGRQSEAQQTQIVQAYDSDAAAFSQREPMFAPAYQFLMANRICELALYYFDKDMTAQGATLSPQELAKIRNTVAAEENEIVTMALKEGKSPSERMFKMARARGFRPPVAAAPANNGQNGAAKPGTGAASNGKAPQNGKAPGSLADAAAAVDAQPAAGAAPAVNVLEEIERVKRGVDSSTSLSHGGGAPSLGALTPEKLANMPQEEFNAMMDQLSPAEQRRAMGG